MSKNKFVWIRIDGVLEEIDKDICDAIEILNKKGYKTYRCCAGHDKKKSFCGYVYFQNELDHKYGKPIGWFYDEELDKVQHFDEMTNKIIRYNFDKDEQNKQEVVDRMMKNLKIWVDGLEDLHK